MDRKRPIFVSVAVPRPLFSYYTYTIENIDCNPSDLVRRKVRVPFGRTALDGWIVSVEEQSNVEKIKSVLTLYPDHHRVPVALWEMIQFASQYYQYPLGELLLSTSWKDVEEKKIKNLVLSEQRIVELNTEQQAALKQIQHSFLESPQKPALLQGATGSGKTEVYIELMKSYRAQNKSVLILVPEIGLTQQTKARIESILQESVGLWHSAMTANQKAQLSFALQNGTLSILLGARSAIFAPLINLGLIIIDEEHDPSYKQEERARYNAKDLAQFRSKYESANLLLTSATPSFETLHKAKNHQFSYAFLPAKYSLSQKTDIQFVDLFENDRKENTPFTDLSIESIEGALNRGEQILVFVGRRGFSPYFICSQCSYVFECDTCSVSLTYYKNRKRLQCHSCGTKHAVPTHCSKCSGYDLRHVGDGTESVTDFLKKKFTSASIVQFDRDQITSQTRLDRVLEDFRSQKTQIMVGTQMLTKGHDFPNVTLVVIPNADQYLRFPDFRAPEHAYQLLKQVAGRTGRGEKQGKVIIETYDPDHLVYKTLLDENFETEFIQNELNTREALHYPPFGRLIRLRLTHKEPSILQTRSDQLSHYLKEQPGIEHVEILGPSEGLPFKLRLEYRHDLLLRSNKRMDLQKLALISRRFCNAREWSLIVDVDPLRLL